MLHVHVQDCKNTVAGVRLHGSQSLDLVDPTDVYQPPAYAREGHSESTTRAAVTAFSLTLSTLI